MNNVDRHYSPNSISSPDEINEEELSYALSTKTVASYVSKSTSPENFLCHTYLNVEGWINFIYFLHDYR